MSSDLKEEQSSLTLCHIMLCYVNNVDAVPYNNGYKLRLWLIITVVSSSLMGEFQFFAFVSSNLCYVNQHNVTPLSNDQQTIFTVYYYCNEFDPYGGFHFTVFLSYQTMLCKWL